MALALDSPIVDTFGMQVTDASRLSDSAFGFIAPDAEDFDSLQRRTFKSFLTTTPDGRDAESLLDTAESPAAVRFVAARIGKWLERELLGPQDVLIDVSASAAAIFRFYWGETYPIRRFGTTRFTGHNGSRRH